MELYLAGLVGTLYAVALYLMLRRSVLRLVLGLAILSHAANLLIFTAASVRRGAIPIVRDDTARVVADPLPQALILTAIVISFAVLGYALVLARRACLVANSDDADVFRRSEA
jgi:multicomponent Na+:H+ antiporter subunit C